ncbi:hypothetical protein Q4498_01665 [Neptunomonas phycophila]|uniref:hypothetical protein n=1 Tax=Neptunomonas phycophila TaxID=1572645 RepID=UPI0026E45045|nr:hypothetical protein [Neptunomonas phycophila]MDO6466805.1 hypothetical protein [Neptunomonas phycophila]
MSKTNFVVNPSLTAIAIAYTNAAFVADKVLPRLPVGGRQYKWKKYNTEERFTIPDTSVGRTGRPNEIEFGFTDMDGSVKDFGLEDPIPNEDILQAKNTIGFNPKGHATEMLSELVALGREKRVADLVFNPNTYGAGYKEVITGTDQWNDKANAKPIVQLLDALETPMVRPNVMTLGSNAALQLRQHPDVIKAYNGTLGDQGLVPLAYLRELLELEEIIVGRAKYNAASKGQEMNLSKLWGNHCSLIYRNRNARPQGGVTFGWTAAWEGRVAMTRQDDNIGLRGGVRVRVGESVNEQIVCDDVAYFLENVVA